MHFFTKLCIKTVIFFPPLLDRKCLVWHFLFISWHKSHFETSKQPSREEALSDSLAAQRWGDPAPALAHPQPTHFLHLFLSVPFVPRRFTAPVTVLCQQELPQQAQTSVWPLAHCGWPETRAPSRVCWPQYRPRPSPSTTEALPRQKAHPRVTKRGVPWGWSSDNTELKLGCFSFGQRFNYFIFFLPSQLFLVHGFSSPCEPAGAALFLWCCPPFRFCSCRRGLRLRGRPMAEHTPRLCWLRVI